MTTPAIAPAVSAAPTIAWPEPPQGLDADRLVWAETVRGNGYTHFEVARGTTLRITDLEGDACAHLLAYHADVPAERLNVAETVRVQDQETLTAGCLLISDRGRALATIVRDTSGRHDPLFGSSSRRPRAGAEPAGPELLGFAAAKHDLGPRDLAPGVAFFQGVEVDDAGRPRFLGSAGPGASVVLRVELPLVVLLANTAHPLDPRPEQPCSRIEVLAWRDRPTRPDDPEWAASPSARRAYLQTAAYLAAQRPPPAGRSGDQAARPRGRAR
ncbi:urea amidolyase associated protein UAAP1 [Pengzhenrongella sicca]|uniref:DUF1989 domain-containing protein n=1 Tax=Pengzhenrongella sicca TaxID=2819238 RepID=A0A8A4ZDT0_9MICO|nr:urea amidolyase associated protein UAAP1 [Pengzhenrongella sicca]QTE29179.1 DUF1989 domain-containing protein [Pengzhenrongella sicca]